MTWTVAYFNERVKREVFALPAGILAGYLRLLELIYEFGADLRMPHSRAMGDGLFELRPRAGKASGACFTACKRVSKSSFCIRSSRRRRKPLKTNCTRPVSV
jgi:hypothetical protein